MKAAGNSFFSESHKEENADAIIVTALVMCMTMQEMPESYALGC